MSLSAEAPFPFEQGERLTFGVILTGSVAGLTYVMSHMRWGPITWCLLDQRTFAQIGTALAAYVGPAFLTTSLLVLAGFTDIGFTGSSDAFFRIAYLLALVFLSEALPEELLFRGWLMESLKSCQPPSGPILGQAALFTVFAWAVGGVASLHDASFIACFGLVLGILRSATGTIWACVGLHVAFITAQQSGLPPWTFWEGNPRMPVQVVGLTIVPFSVIVGMLYGRVGGKLNQSK